MSRQLSSVVLALGLSFAAYGNALDNPFHFDDAHSIVDNVWLTDLANVPRFFTDVATFSPLSQNRSYRPVLLTGFAISHALGGGAPWGYHLGTLLLHVLGAWLVGWLLVRFLRSEGYDEAHAHRAGLVATAAFAVHPLLSEPVNYASARSSLQAAVFMLAAIALYVSARTAQRPRLLWASSGVLLLAMGTKITAMTAPALMLGWDLLLGPARSRRDPPFRALLGPTAVCIAFTLIHEIVVGAQARGARSQISALSYLYTEIQVWMLHIGQFIWPEDLNADRIMRWSEVPWEGPVVRAALLAFLLVAFAWRRRRQRPTVLLGVLWYFVALSPTSSVVPLSEPASEHRVYIAVPGLVWAASALLAGWARRQEWSRAQARWATAVVVAVIAALGLRTQARNRVWASDLALWQSVVDASPTNGRGHLNHGLAMMKRGDLPGAQAAFDRCVQHWPYYSFCYLNRAVLALRQRRLTVASQEIATAERLAPDNVYVHLWKGKVESAHQRWPSAQRAFERALAIAPRMSAADRGWASSVFEQGDFPAAKATLARLEASGQLDAEGWFAWGYLAQRDGRSQEAQRAYEASLRLDPGNARSGYNLGVLHHQAGRLAEAAGIYERLARDRAVSEEVLDNLARVYWRQGRLDAARAVRSRLRAKSPGYPGLTALTF